MRRPGPLPLGLAGLGLLALCGLAAGWREAAGAYLAAWLVLLALPVGALPVTIVAERFGRRVRERGGIEMLAALRRLMALMPAAALLGLPVLAAVPLLYPWQDSWQGAWHHLWPGAPSRTPLAAAWFTPPLVAGRVALCLGLWTLLAARFARPFDAPGEGRTVPAVALHAVLGTLFVADVIAALDPRLGSALLPILVMTAWSGLAFAAAILLAWEEPEPVGRGRTAPGRGRLVPLVVLLALWAYMQGAQYLIVRSAGLPAEAAWYLARGGWTGRALALAGGLVAALAAVQLLRPGRVTTRALAGAAVAVHALEMAWLVTPALRGRFEVGWIDGLAALAVACLAAALRAGLAGQRREPRPDARRRRRGARARPARGSARRAGR